MNRAVMPQQIVTREMIEADMAQFEFEPREHLKRMNEKPGMFQSVWHLGAVMGVGVGMIAAPVVWWLL